MDSLNLWWKPSISERPVTLQTFEVDLNERITDSNSNIAV